MKWCAKQKRAYHLVSTADLEKIAKSTHHEGIMVLVKGKKPVSISTIYNSLSPLARQLDMTD